MRLAPWSTYSWRVEVLGAPEPGSSVPGAWSAPSAPVSWRVVPAAPVAVTGGTAVMTAAGVGVRFTSPDPLDGGPAGDYVLDVNRVSAAAPAPSDAVGSYSAAAIRQPDGSYRVIDTRLDVVTGSTYLVEVCDPIGRRSARVVAATL